MSFQQLDYYSLIKFSGIDAENFLQGQLTNDISQLSNQWQFNGYCNPKGRLLAILKLWTYQQDFYALLPKDLVESIVKRLKMYVLRSKVEIECLENQNIFACYDATQLSKLTSELTCEISIDLNIEDDTNSKLIHADESTTILGFKSRFLIITSSLKGDLVSSFLQNETWLQQDIKDGIPDILPASSELFVPQMVNLDLLGGISFKKGCYTGQEIVARMHYLGKLKQRLFVCVSNSETSISIADKIFIDNDGKHQAVGDVLMVDTKSDSTERKLLAVIRIEHRNKTLKLKNGDEISVLPQQPFDIEFDD